MKQPTHLQDDSDPTKSHRESIAEASAGPPPMWRRPPGVAPGTWQYLHQRTIADHYDAFVEDTPLCRVDAELLCNVLPEVSTGVRPCVLDLGCGSGRAALPLARRGYDVVGIDLSQPMLRVLQKKAAAEPTPGTIYSLRANLVELDGMRDQSADHAICMFATMGMIQGRKHRRSSLRHVARIVRPGGTLVVHVHNRWSALCERGGYGYLARSWFRSLRNSEREFGDATYGYRGLQDMFMHRFSKRELIRDLESTGWEIDQLLRLSIDGQTVLQSHAIAGGFIAIAKCSPSS